MGDLSTAASFYAWAIKLAPDEAVYLRYLVSFSLNYSYQIEQIALPAARQAVVLAPRDSETLDLMAQVLMKQGDLSNAERFLHRALQYQPDFSPAILHLGIVHLSQNNLALAQQEFQQVLLLAPGSPAAEQAQRLLDTYFPNVLQ